MKIHTKRLKEVPKRLPDQCVFHRKEFQRHVKHSIGVWEESNLFSHHQGKARERNPHKKCSLSFLAVYELCISYCWRFFLFFFFLIKEFYYFLFVKKMTKSNACVFCMGFFFSPFLDIKRPPISNTLFIISGLLKW